MKKRNRKFGPKTLRVKIFYEKKEIENSIPKIICDLIPKNSQTIIIFW